MKNQNFQFSFTTSKDTGKVFEYLRNPKNWWVGLYGESIEGESSNINDEFSFRAGDGVHYSRQKLVKLLPGQKIVWLVTESNLSFIQNTNEWTGTKICLDIEKVGEKTKITFMHEGLTPLIACYASCSGAWTQYLHNLQEHLG